MRSLMVWLMLVTAVPCLAQFRLPKVPRLPGGGGIGIPGLDNILSEDPPLTTSFKDAVTGVRYYDDFNPRVDVAMAEMPRGLKHSFMLAPGGYEVILQSYCLNAGTHGPGRGEGYQFAPLKGSLAGVLGDIMDRSADHPEVSQHDVQALLWGVEAKTKISEMPPKLQQAAAKLLTPAQIDKLNGGALGKVPPELMEQTFVKVPAPMRRAMQARAELRNMLSEATPDFGALERVAVLSGDPPDEKGGEVVPRERWSYRPGGFFVRYFPEGYSKTRTQVFVPPDVQVVKDDRGRLVSLTDAAGNRVETEYDDAVAPATVPGDNGVSAYALAKIRFTRQNSKSPGQTEQAECTGAGWVLVGVPSGKGKPAPAAERYAGLPERYTAATAHHAELAKLIPNVRKVGQHPAPATESPEIIARMTDLASYTTGLSAAIQGGPSTKRWVTRVADLPRVAWGANLVYVGEGGANGTPVGQARPVGGDGTRLAAANVGSLGIHLLTPWAASKGSGLRSFDSSGSATPANTGRQRLGQSPRPSDDQDDAGTPEAEEGEDEDQPQEEGSDKSILDRARNAIDWIGKGMNVVNAVTDPAGTIAGQLGFGIQDQLQSSFFDWTFDTASTISQALGGDPPRSDFNLIATPEALPAASMTPQWGNIPPARAAALSALRMSLISLVANLRAGQVSVDRLGGAIQANDEQWVTQQSEALLHHKRQSGAAMVVVADRLEALLAELKAEGIQRITMSPEGYRRYQERLKGGLSPLELEAARSIGLSDAEVEAGRQRRLAYDPNEVSGDLLAQTQTAAQSLRELGERWWRLPEGAEIAK
ncbi:MAG: hypothetical protein ABFE07_27305 [Armatimonadia bacterium]